MKLFQKQVRSCKDCPNSWRSYYGSYLFCRADPNFRAKSNDEADVTPYDIFFPDWCPLEDFKESSKQLET